MADAWLSERNTAVADRVEGLYAARPDIVFHDLGHALFVASKSVEAAAELGCSPQEIELVEAAGLTHDFNYLLDVRSGPEAGEPLRREHLTAAGFTAEERDSIEQWIAEADTARRGPDISLPAKALSDGDTVYKLLPGTPVLLSQRYRRERGVGLREWAETIVRYQKPLLETDCYLYTPSFKRRYLGWAAANLAVVENVLAALDDPLIAEFISHFEPV